MTGNHSVRARIAPGVLYALGIALMTTSCTSSLHGSYAPTSYVGGEATTGAPPLGPVEGSSCQTKFLYVLPLGQEVSTRAAIQSAKTQREGTRYLADISIDDRTRWGLGYSEQCITVDAVAY